MPHRQPRHDLHGARHTQWFAAASGVLLVLCWALGGVTVDSSGADEFLQLLAVPVLLWGAGRLAQAPMNRTLALALAFAAAILLVPLWQLLPLPQALGLAGTARAEVASDLAEAGVTLPAVHASLWPYATEQALWSLLPALALFLGALTLAAPLRRRLLQLVLGLALASAAFAFFQLSLPDGSPLLLYTSWGRNFGGLFVNSNHQGGALAIGAVISCALFVEGRRRAMDDEGNLRYWLYGFLAVACMAMVPLANGSAAVLLVLAGLVAVLVLLGTLGGLGGGGRRRLLQLAAVGLVVAITLASALAWRQVDVDRRYIARQTVEAGHHFAPFGTGVGSFVPVFAQSQDTRQARSEQINHAHNEYVQWWLEGGVPALLALGIGLGLFTWAGWQVLTRLPSRRMRAVAAPAWAGLLILLVHSLVDFPLRTSALMATAGLLAGLLFAVLADAGRTVRSRSESDDALQQA